MSHNQIRAILYQIITIKIAAKIMLQNIFFVENDIPVLYPKVTGKLFTAKSNICGSHVF